MSRFVLFTGATGQVGRPLLKRMIERKDLVIRVATPDAPQKGENVEWVPSNFLEDVDYDALMRDVETVFHLGAETKTRVSDMEQVNVVATRRLAQAAERSVSVKRFLYTSTTMVYGYPQERVLKDEAPLAKAPSFPFGSALAVYGKSKYDSELALQATAKCVQYVLVRPTMLLTDDLIGQMFSASLPSKIWRGHRISHFIHVDEAARALMQFLDDKPWKDVAAGAVMYCNFSADTWNFRERDVYFPPSKKLASMLAALLPNAAERIKDMAKYRTLSMGWPYGCVVFSPEKLAKLGIILAPLTHSKAMRAQQRR